MNVIMAIEDAALNKQNLYALCIDFSSAFNTTDHDKQLRIMKATGYPEDAIKAVRSVYTNTTTTVLTPHGNTDPIKVERGTIQGDNLSPLLFLIYIEPLLRWLHSGGRGYQFGCLNKELNLRHNISAPAFADDLDILVNNIGDLHIQVSKVNSFNIWAGLDANADKSIATAILHRNYETGLIPKSSSPCNGPRIRNQLEGKITLGGKPVPYLPPDEPYKYLGVWLTLTLNWKYQLNKTLKDIKTKGEAILASMASTKQKLRMINQVIRPGITYDLPLAFYNPQDISKMDNKIASLARKTCWLPNSSPTTGILSTQEQGGLGIISLWTDYIQLSTSMITKALNDTGRLGTVTRALLNLQNNKTGALIMDMTPQNIKYLTPLKMIAMCSKESITIMDKGNPVNLEHNALWEMVKKARDNSQKDKTENLTLKRKIHSEMIQPLTDLGTKNLADITTRDGQYIICTLHLTRTYDNKAHPVTPQHKRDLKRITLIITGSYAPGTDPMQHTKTSPLSRETRKLPQDPTSEPQVNHPKQHIKDLWKDLPTFIPPPTNGDQEKQEVHTHARRAQGAPKTHMKRTPVSCYSDKENPTYQALLDKGDIKAVETEYFDQNMVVQVLHKVLVGNNTLTIPTKKRKNCSNKASYGSSSQVDDRIL